jgi:ubiquinone/menaquinone biosynthesis C-methylase UbiE
MPRDLYTRLNDLDEPTVRSIAEILELRGRHPRQAAIRRAYLDLLGDLTGQRVLEVGCGTGVAARDVARRVGPTGHVTGTDPTPILIEVAERLRVEQGLDNLTLAVEDGRSLPFADASFDLTAAVTVLCHVPERADVLREMMRVTRPGGTVLIFDGEYAANQIHHPDRSLTERVLDGWRASSIDDPHLMRRIVPFLEATGLETVRVDGYVHVEAGQVDEATSFIWQWSQFAARQAITIGTVTETEATRWTEQLRDLNRRAELFGSVTYVSVVARKP